MAENLTITKEKALQIYDNSNASKQVLLEELFCKASFELSPMERIKTIDDILQSHGITREQFENTTVGLTEDEKAYRLIKMLVETLNQGWIPNWDDSSEYKYFPLFETSSSGFRFGGCDYWFSTSTVSLCLAFKSRELAEYAGKQFTELYKQFMII